MEMVADFEEVAASCGYFSFSLQDLASEMKVYLSLLEDLKYEVEERPGGRTWSWLKFWRFFGRPAKEDDATDPGKNNTPSRVEQDLCLGCGESSKSSRFIALAFVKSRFFYVLRSEFLHWISFMEISHSLTLLYCRTTGPLGSRYCYRHHWNKP